MLLLFDGLTACDKTKYSFAMVTKQTLVQILTLIGHIIYLVECK